jgi:hypothetical protein
MATFSVLRPRKILGRNTLDIPVLQPIRNQLNAISRSLVSKKPLLLPKEEYNQIKPLINLVDFNPFEGLTTDSNKPFSPRLINWVEPYLIRGFRKTLFYTEVNSGLKEGDRVFIIGGNYDSDLLIEEDKYKKGRDGYKVLYVDKCQVVLDIDYTGQLPYIIEDIDKFIKVHYVSDEGEFINVNRQFTTRGGSFDYRFSYNQNNVIFTDQDFTNISFQTGYGANGGLTSSPGFFIRDDENTSGNGTYSWINVTSTILSGTFSNISSLTYSINDRIKILNKSFTYQGQEFKEGYVYKFYVGPTQSVWIPDVRYIQPIIAKGNFRDGNFKGTFNTGLFGSPNKKINWNKPEAIFYGGSIMRTLWNGGTIESKFSLPESYSAEFGPDGLPSQKTTGPNNNGRGYNFIFDSDILSSTIKNASIYGVQLGTYSNSFSVVEDRIISTTSNFSNIIESGYFERCKFYNSTITNSEFKKCESINSLLTNVKSVNSNYKDSVFLNSVYINDPIINISGYDEFLISEKRTLTSTFSSVFEASHKVYKFYISETSYNRLKSSDDFYIRGLKVNDSSKSLINFFDKKFRISSWTEFDDFFYSSTDPNILNLPTIGNTPNTIDNDSFYKRGQQISCFLSSPEDNDWTFTSTYVLTTSGYHTKAISQNNKKGYSLDVVVDLRDNFNNLISGLNFNYDSTSTDINSLTSSNVLLGNIIDISNAFIIESDFDSGLFENSDWNSGRNINNNQDNNITKYSAEGGFYNLTVVTQSNTIIATTSYTLNSRETELDFLTTTGSVVFLNSVYYDTRGKIDGLFILVSNPGSGYVTSTSLTTTTPVGATGLSIDITASIIGEAQSITLTLGGTGYPDPDGTYTKTTTGGSGTGLTVDVTIATNIITSISINSGGSGYIAGESITVNGTSGTPASFNITTINNGEVTSVTIVSGGRGYQVGDNLTISSGNNDAVIQVTSVTGSLTRLEDAYKIINNNNGEIHLQEIATQSVISNLLEGGVFYTPDSNNRWGYIHKSKIWKSKIKSGLFRRSYIKDSFIEDSNYDTTDIDFLNYDRIKNLVLSDILFTNNNNLLSKATYMRSYFINGNDVWNNGIIFESIWNSGTFSRGVFKNSNWETGIFENSKFYLSRSFNAQPTVNSPYYDVNNLYSYYKNGLTTATISNNRNSWKTGTFKSGEFIKSDWESGLFENGSFYGSKWYSGTFSNGTIGLQTVPSSETKFYNGEIKYTTVNNAELYAIDTSLYGLSQSNIIWRTGIFNSGVFGSDIIQTTASHTATWEDGVFNGGDFKTNAVWKTGIFNGGKFTSGYEWQSSSLNITSISSAQTQYSWQDGVFNGGEFGNAEYGTNSTWYTGQFNGGKFIGRLWYDGIFTNGEFVGGSTWSAVGGYSVDGMTESNALNFVDSYNTDFYGLWLDGRVSPVIDEFITDVKVFDKLVTIKEKILKKPKTYLKNMLWLSGTFSHPNAEIHNSVWLDGTFRKGKFYRSSFNPFVKRNGSTSSSFNLNDDLINGSGSCVWENGTFENSDFYISQWNQGKFLSGTAFGMVWRNGTSNYMNAYNIFWEDGIWRNGNWHGSYFQFDGSLDDSFNRQILFRGMSYSGTSSLHIWNVFTGNSTNTNNITSAIAATPSSGLDLLVASAVPALPTRTL